MVYLGDAIDPSLVGQLAHFTQRLKSHFSSGIVEVVPSYTSVLIEFCPLRVEVANLLVWCREQIQRMAFEAHSDQPLGKLVHLPVFYHPDVAPDLMDLARLKSLSIEQVIDIHSQTEYTVCAIGFAPGFAFLGSVDPRIAIPRHHSPRLKVAQGSVGIADQQTAVYPLDTPGGWNIIGNCPQTLFDVNASPMMPFDVGDRVKFEPINREVFIELGGML
jgi:KipI family sensor histidine kinase inhibitor